MLLTQLHVVLQLTDGTSDTKQKHISRKFRLIH